MSFGLPATMLNCCSSGLGAPAHIRELRGVSPVNVILGTVLKSSAAERVWNGSVVVTDKELANTSRGNDEILATLRPVWLFADPLRLEQVFVNLLANASRYTDTGGELAVWMHIRGDQAVVRIRDSGIGIAAEALPHIFDLFRQANEASAYCKSGLGVGLALVRNLLELHGGSVTAASAGIRQGSEFTVRLPKQDC